MMMIHLLGSWLTQEKGSDYMFNQLKLPFDTSARCLL